MELRQQIEALIIKGKTDRALNLLKNQEGLPKSFHDEITLLQSIFEKNEKERGTLVSYDDADIQRNRINLKTLNLTSDIAKYQNAPKRSPKNLFRKPALRTPETNDLAGEVDNIRQKLLERYEHRLEQKTDNRLPVELELTYTKEGTSPDYLHFDKDIISEKLQGDLVDTLKKHRHLLIVGKPGAGKTTQLLELAKAWLSDNTNEQIPVIFNLSAWKADNQYMHDWLQAALVSGYGFSPSLAKEAMDKQQIIPLLDGLDEVGKDKADDTKQTDLRNQCLDAISKYLTLYNTPYLAICSRIKEFAAADDAPVKAAIMVNPLTPQAIKRTLKEALTKTQKVNNETAATTLLNLLPKHPVLEDILCTPFYYNIALDVFDDRTTRHDLPQEQADLELYLIEQFIAKKLDTTDNPHGFSEERTRGSLAWVADVLERESWVSFELVDFQPRYLRRELLMNLVLGLGFALIYGVFFGLVLGLDLGLFLGLVLGLMVGVMGNFNIQPSEVRKVEWSNLFKLSTWKHNAYEDILGNLILGAFFGVLLGVVQGIAGKFFLCLVLGVVGGLIVGLFFYLVKVLVDGLVVGLIGGLVEGLVFGLVGGLIFGLVGGLVEGLGFGLVFGLTGGLTYGLIRDLIKKVFVITTFSTVESPYHRLRSDVLFQIIKFTIVSALALCVAFFTLNYFNISTISWDALLIIVVIIVIALISPLFTSFSKHFVLRLALYLEKKMPLRWVSFFRYATSARILEQDGGQWRFRHQILQDYFAERWRG